MKIFHIDFISNYLSILWKTGDSRTDVFEQLICVSFIFFGSYLQKRMTRVHTRTRGA